MRIKYTSVQAMIGLRTPNMTSYLITNLVRCEFIGTWSGAASYSIKDVVQSGGSLYYCKVDNTNQEPPNSTYWDLFVSKGDQGDIGAGGATLSQVYPVGCIYTSTISTNPATVFGFGTWSAFGAGRIMVGLDANQTEFDVVEETGGAKTVSSAGTISAPTISGSTAAEATHTHSVTSNVAVADHSAHTHSVTSNVTATVNEPTFTITGTKFTTSGSGTAAATAFNGTTISSGSNSPSNPAQTVTVTNNAVTSGNPGATLTHTVTNNAVTSGAGASHLHGAGTLAASAPTFTGSATSVLPPYIVVYLWKRTA